MSVSTICDEYCLSVWRAWTGNVTVNNLIRSMSKRIDMVIRNEGKRRKILKKYHYFHFVDNCVRFLLAKCKLSETIITIALYAKNKGRGVVLHISNKRG